MDEMIIHQREIGYGKDYPAFFEALGKVPRATPLGLARLPKIYLWKRYQISQGFLTL